MGDEKMFPKMRTFLFIAIFSTYGISKSFNSWFWIDANDQASSGSWVHASTAKDVEWFNPKWTCWSDGHFGANGGDAMEMNIGTNKHYNGAWCDANSSYERRFICKGRMPPDV